MNASLLAFRLIGLLLLSALPSIRAAETFKSLYISEILVENERGLKDADGDRPGWIEIHNGSSARLNLSGWFLTDNKTNLTQWRFPRVALLPDKDLVVFASGQERTNRPPELHTSFRLNPEGGYLALVNPATNIVSELTYPAGTRDVSFGRLREEPARLGSFRKPTPGQPNMTAGKGFAPPVTFSRPSANFIEPFTVELSTASPGAVIRYTRDGTIPTTNSLLYEGPLLITNTTHLRARAFADGLPGPPESAAYLQLATNAVAFRSSLPLLIMDVLGRNVRTSPEDIFVRLSLHEPIDGRTSLTNAPALTTRAGFRVRGSTSSGFPQSPFSVEFLDEFNDKRSLSPLGLPEDAEWVLYAPNAYDPIMIHNPFIYQLSRDMGRYSPRTRFVEVFLVRDAGPVKATHYQGLYVLTEKIKVGKQRVNIDRLGASDLELPRVSGGYLMKFDRVGPGESGFYGSGDRGLVYVDPKEEVINLPQRAPQRDYLRSFFSDFLRALHGPKWKDPNAGYRAFLDVDAAIDFHVLEVLSGNVDAMVLSTYFHKPRNGKIVCGPHWDFDRALGSIDERDANPRQWNTGPFFGGEWWPRLFSDVDFWQAWVDRWQELRTTHFSQTNLFRLVDDLCSEVREAQPREYARWGLEPRGGSYDGEIRHMKDWLSNRLDFIDHELVAPPLLMHGKAATTGQPIFTFRSATNTTIYYTVDGTDPRLPEGAISPRAIPYSGPVQSTNGLRLVARAHNPRQLQRAGPPVSTPWSGPLRKDL
jgi:hypothetical protein